MKIIIVIAATMLVVYLGLLYLSWRKFGYLAFFKSQIRSIAVAALVSTAMLALAPPASAADNLPVKDALMLLTALRNLDGRPVVVEQNGQRGTVVQPWEFKSGLLRLKIAENIAALAVVERAVDEARMAIVRQVSKKFELERIDPDTPAFAEFSKLYQEVLNAPTPGADGLSRIKASDLKLDQNEISVTVLAALKPILDMDVK
jgi:hypothetical protein